MTHMLKLSRCTARPRAAALALALTFAAACDSADRLSPTDTGTANPETDQATDSTATDSTAADSTGADSTGADSMAVAEGMSLYTSSTAPGVPFGAFGLPMSQYAYTSTWSASLKHLSPSSSAITELAAAKTYGARVVVSLAGARSSYKNSDGTFSMSKWKYNVSKFRYINISPFITDGTIIGHYLIDEPNWAAGWGGERVGHAELEEMARYSKSIWPAMATTVRVRPGGLIGYPWRYLDFAWAQWEGPLHVPSYRMTAAQFRDKQIADARAAGLKLMFGINFLDAGDGRSRILGTYRNSGSSTINRWQMSAAEVEQVGKVLASATYACGLLGWRWSTNYPKHWYMSSSQLWGIRNFNNRSDVKTALKRVAYAARSRTKTSCRR